VAAPGNLNAHRQRQPFAKTTTAPRHGAPGDLLVMAALIGISRVFLAPKKHGPVGRMARAVKETPQPESGRGREAETPHGIPARGWKDIAWRVYEGVQNDRVLLVAAGVTFYSLLALFPATAAVVSLYGLFADAGTINQHLGLVSGFMPAGALEVVGDQVKRVASQGQATLGFTFFFTLVVALWGANAGTKSIFDALNIIYKEREKRSFIGLTLQSLAFTLGAVALVLMAIAGIVVVPVAIKLLGIPEGSRMTLLTMLRWPLLYLVILFALACLYRYGPSRTKPRWRWVTWGSAIAGGIWIIGSLLLSWYIANFGNYNATYGSLGAVIGFMVWIWLSTIIVLLGGEVNAELEHQTAKDTTDGERKPLGTRGAQMADSIGKASS
jgi:membrane protein